MKGIAEARAKGNEPKNRHKITVEKVPLQNRNDEKESTMKSRAKAIIELGLKHVRSQKNKIKL